MRRLSWPGTFLFCRFLPALFVVFLGAVCVWQSSIMIRDGQWGMSLLLIAFLGGAGMIGWWRASVWDAWVSDDMLVLRRGRAHEDIPIGRLTKLEVPMESLQLLLTVWVHWTDTTGAPRTARFLTWRTPEWTAFRQRVITRYPVLPSG